MEKNSEELRKMEDFFFSPTEIGTRKLKLGKKKSRLFTARSLPFRGWQGSIGQMT